jgi:hypothetical protein
MKSRINKTVRAVHDITAPRLPLVLLPLLLTLAITLGVTLLASCTPTYVVRREYFAYNNTPQYQQAQPQGQPQSQVQDSTQQWQNPMAAPAPQATQMAYVPIISPWYDDIAVSYYAGPSFSVGVGFGWNGGWNRWNTWNNWGWGGWNRWNTWNAWNNWGWGGGNSFAYNPWCSPAWGGGWAGGWNGWARPWNGWNSPYQQRWNDWRWNNWRGGSGQNGNTQIVNNYYNGGNGFNTPPQQQPRRDFGVQRPYNYTNNPQPTQPNQPNVPNQAPALGTGGTANSSQNNAGYSNYPSYNGVGGRVRSANDNNYYTQTPQAAPQMQKQQGFQSEQAIQGVGPTQSPNYGGRWREQVQPQPSYSRPEYSQPVPQQYSRPSYSQPSYSQPAQQYSQPAQQYSQPSWGGAGGKGGSFNSTPSYRAPSNSNYGGGYGGGAYKSGGGYSGSSGGGYGGSSSGSYGGNSGGGRIR